MIIARNNTKYHNKINLYVNCKCTCNKSIVKQYNEDIFTSTQNPIENIDELSKSEHTCNIFEKYKVVILNSDLNNQFSNSFIRCFSMQWKNYYIQFNEYKEDILKPSLTVIQFNQWFFYFFNFWVSKIYKWNVLCFLIYSFINNLKILKYLRNNFEKNEKKKIFFNDWNIKNENWRILYTFNPRTVNPSKYRKIKFLGKDSDFYTRISWGNTHHIMALN